MTTTLTERRKADRAKMAAMVADLCAELGAEFTLRDDATHVWPDGSRSSRTRRLLCSIRIDDATVGVDFDGDNYSMTDCYCMPWNVHHESDKRFSSDFGWAVGAEVNRFHRRKCMGFADGIDTLLARLRAAIECVNDGRAFEPV